MRYLSKFNEEESFETDLREFSNDYLSYIKDKGFTVQIEYLRFKSITKHFRISIVKRVSKEGYGVLNGTFNYSEIEDDFIQFIKMLDSNYNVSNREFEYSLANQRKDASNSILNSITKHRVKIDKIETVEIDKLSELSMIIQSNSR